MECEIVLNGPPLEFNDTYFCIRRIAERVHDVIAVATTKWNAAGASRLIETTTPLRVVATHYWERRRPDLPGSCVLSVQGALETLVQMGVVDPDYEDISEITFRTCQGDRDELKIQVLDGDGPL